MTGRLLIPGRAACTGILLLWWCTPLPAEAQPRTLLQADFGEPDALAEWTVSVGAVTGPGPSSTVEWEDGAVRLAGTAETGSWLALTRQVDVAGAAWILVRGRVRVADVDSATARYPNCNLFVRHTGGLVASRILTGTHDWTPVRRLVQLPAGESQVTLGLFLSMPGRAWFSDVVIESVEAPGWTDSVAGPYRYRTLPGDSVPEAARRFNEATYERVRDVLGVPAPRGPLTYVKYPDVATLEAFTGRAGNAHREGPVIHTIWATDDHEIVHILADAWGDPPALLAEGLAVHLAERWQGADLRDVARGLLADGDWIAPSTLLSSTEFRAQPDRLTYPLAGVLVGWIVEVYGRDTLRVLYGRLDNAAPIEVNREVLRESLGRDLEAIDEAVVEWLNASHMP